MTSPYALSDVSAVDDIIDQGRFMLLLGNIPGWGDTTSLSARCFQATIPGTSSEVMEVPLHQFVLRYRGRKINVSPMSVSFYEDSTYSAYSALWAWSEYVTGTESGNSSGYLSDYSIVAQLSTFDTMGLEVARFLFYNMFIQDLTDISLSSDASSPTIIQASFAFRNKAKIDVSGGS